MRSGSGGHAKMQGTTPRADATWLRRRWTVHATADPEKEGANVRRDAYGISSYLTVAARHNYEPIAVIDVSARSTEPLPPPFTSTIVARVIARRWYSKPSPLSAPVSSSRSPWRGAPSRWRRTSRPAIPSAAIRLQRRRSGRANRGTRRGSRAPRTGPGHRVSS